MHRSELIALYRELADLPADASRSDKQARGYKFQQLLDALLTSEMLAPRIGFRPGGEEIDGSFVLDGRVYLLEAKWQRLQPPASSIYMFKGKVDGKLVGTIGIFISMSGYGRDAVEALTHGKSLNVILFDKEDIEVSISGRRTFSEVLRRKLRAAAEGGVVYLESETKEVVSRRTPGTNQVDVQEHEVDVTQVSVAAATENIAVICEGVTDEAILSALTTRILRENGLEANVRFLRAMGKSSLPRLANALRGIMPTYSRIIIVADSDGDIEGTQKRLLRDLQNPVDLIIIAHPEIEAWFYPSSLSPKAEAVREFGPHYIQKLAEKARTLDLAQLTKDAPSFAEYYKQVANWARG